MSTDLIALREQIENGELVPYLGHGALDGSVSLEDGSPIPADSDSLILAMNGGQPMAPRLMYEFPRAAMHLELKKGRAFVNNFLTKLYAEKTWSRAPLHDWLAQCKPAYVVDINRDTQLQESYAGTPHTLVTGISRIGGTEYRFKLFNYDGAYYHEVDQEKVDPTLPILFKPMGTPLPQPHFIASDADYVDYITELMGGFAIPAFLKKNREGLRYVFLGMRFTRDSERMVMSDITYAAGEPKGWALIAEPTEKEKRFCARQNIQIVNGTLADFLQIHVPPQQNAQSASISLGR